MPASALLHGHTSATNLIAGARWLDWVQEVRSFTSSDFRVGASIADLPDISAFFAEYFPVGVRMLQLQECVDRDGLWVASNCNKLHKCTHVQLDDTHGGHVHDVLFF